MWCNNDLSNMVQIRLNIDRYVLGLVYIEKVTEKKELMYLNLNPLRTTLFSIP